MPCVNDHADFLAMAAGWADPLIADLLEAEALVVNPALATLQAQMGQGHHHHHHPHDHGHSHDHDHHHHHP
jgi:ferrochelatase